MILALAALAGPAAPAQELPPVRGIIWQLYEDAPDARGSWHRLGAEELLIQWTAVDGIGFVPGAGARESTRMPDWRRIRAEPWARRFIVGLSGRTSEEETRRSIPAMVEESLAIARRPLPFPVSAWYFPAEVDSSWTEAATLLPPALARLPRPLWISAYDGLSIGPEPFAEWIDSWLPEDVGILFQDSVGIFTRTPGEARRYADALRERLGRRRVRIIAEAFRHAGETGFRPATPEELAPQLAAYRGYEIYLFDGPHYVPEATVDALAGPRR
jgi:hypothetical protein